MEGKVAVLGDSNFVMPFASLGLDTFAFGDGGEDAVEQAKAIVKGGYALVVIAENVAPAVEEVFSSVQNQPTPCVVIVPFTTESQGYATGALGHVLKIATGIDILQNS